MDTIIETFDPAHPDNSVIEKAAGILQQGGLVAFPTETVYGLGGNGLDVTACKKIYAAKGRPSDNPLILHIADVKDLDRIVKYIPEKAKPVIDHFWPGPVTLIFPKADCVPLEITGGFPSVAVRFPSNEIARLVIRKSGLPIAAPSANSSGKPSPTRASHVAYDLNGKIDMIIDGGPTQWGLESTILDVTCDPPMILRPGAVTKEMLEAILGPISVDPTVLKKPEPGMKPKAPGMKYTHYSPQAQVILVKGELDLVSKKINELTKEQIKKGIRVGIMATEQTKDRYPLGQVLIVGNRQHPETIGANLFKMLRKFDYLGVDIVYSEVFDETGEGAAIMNRLNKAAGYHYIEV
ncbi:MAG: threonylcarbamoyl-AMP synthase [Clostridiales bacterium]|nr:threonylcarbamoyl-AMP synthase [Clostridiales bacterium]